jgi:hypothetical protein
MNDFRSFLWELELFAIGNAQVNLSLGLQSVPVSDDVRNSRAAFWTDPGGERDFLTNGSQLFGICQVNGVADALKGNGRSAHAWHAGSRARCRGTTAIMALAGVIAETSCSGDLIP